MMVRCYTSSALPVLALAIYAVCLPPSRIIIVVVDTILDLFLPLAKRFPRQTVGTIG